MATYKIYDNGRYIGTFKAREARVIIGTNNQKTLSVYANNGLKYNGRYELERVSGDMDILAEAEVEMLKKRKTESGKNSKTPCSIWNGYLKMTADFLGRKSVAAVNDKNVRSFHNVDISEVKIPCVVVYDRNTQDHKGWYVGRLFSGDKPTNCYIIRRTLNEIEYDIMGAFPRFTPFARGKDDVPQILEVWL